MAALDRFFDVLRGANPLRARGAAATHSEGEREARAELSREKQTERAIGELAVDRARQRGMPPSPGSQSADDQAETRREMEAELDTQREARANAAEHDA
jgi:hypothetical protein